MSDRDLYLLVSGRWDNSVSLVSLHAALQRSNAGTANAIVNTLRITRDIPVAGRDGDRIPASGQPVTVVVAAARRWAFVVNHSGAARPEATAAFQHGHQGSVAVLDLAKAFDPANSGTPGAVIDFIETGTAGPVGCAITPDQRHLIASSAEDDGREDGGRQVTVIDIDAGKVVRQAALATRGEAADLAPSPHSAPHESFGRFPNPNGVAISPLAGGILFTANGGTNDVAVLDLSRVLAGEPDAEIIRVPVEAGPFGIAASPNGALIAVASREDARTGRMGSTLSLIDVKRAAADLPGAEVARVAIGVDTSADVSRPFDVAFTPDGRRLLATCNQAGVVSFVDVDRALSGEPAETARLALVHPDGWPSRPRGVAVTADSRYAAIVGGPKGATRSSLVWIIDVHARRVAATVTGVGNEAYALAFFERS